MKKHLILYIGLLIFFIATNSTAQEVGYLILTSIPTNAEIRIDGKYVGNTPSNTLTLSAGEHKVNLYYKNYEEKTVTIAIRAGEVIKKQIVLKRISGLKVNPHEEKQLKQSKGKITVFTNPGDCMIYFDSVKVNEKPPFTGEAGAGRHNVMAVFHLTQPFEQDVVIQKIIRVRENKITIVRFDINEKLGKITVIPDMKYAKDCAIYIDGNFVNEPPPFTFPIMAGSHKVKAVYTLNNPQEQNVILKQDAYIRIGKNTKIEFSLKNKVGLINILSNQSNARILIDKKDFGSTPLKKIPLEVGPHYVVVKKVGCIDFTKNITVSAREITNINARLVRLAILNLNVEPHDASILINRVKFQNNSRRYLKPFISYRIQITKPLYETWEKTITPKEGEIIAINTKLVYFHGDLKVLNFVPDSKFLLNDKLKIKVGKKKIHLPIGSYTYSISKPGYFDKSGKFVIKHNKLTAIDGFIKKKTRWDAFIRSAVSPGWGQDFQQKSITPNLYRFTFLGLGLGSVLANIAYNHAVHNYKQSVAEYNKAITLSDIEFAKAKMREDYDTVESKFKLRNIFYALTGTIYLWNLADIFIFPPKWEKNVQYNANLNGKSLSVGLTLNF